MKTTINSHNHKITNSKTIAKERTCNCIDKANARPAKTASLKTAILKSTNAPYKDKMYFDTAETTLNLL